MAATYEPQHVLDKDELALFKLSQSEKHVADLGPKERNRLIHKARNLRDRARTKYVKQVAHTRAVTGTKRGYSGEANERSSVKATMLAQAVESLQTL